MTEDELRSFLRKRNLHCATRGCCLAREPGGNLCRRCLPVAEAAWKRQHGLSEGTIVCRRGGSFLSIHAMPRHKP